MRPTSLDLADAVVQEQVLAQWVDWRSYLQWSLERLELQLHADEAAATFDLDEQADVERGQEIEAALRSLPAQRRTIFEAIREQRREQYAADHDPDEADRLALSELLTECLGDSAHGRRGVVPMGFGENDWYEVDAEALNRVPDLAVYALGRPRNAGWQRWPLYVGLIAAIWLPYAWWSWWPASAAPPPTSTARLLLNEESIAPWSLHEAQFEGELGQRLIRRERSVWPADGGWDAAQLWPLAICLPGDLVSAELIVTSGAGLPARRYRPAPPNTPVDLLVYRCERPDDPPQSRRLVGVQTVAVVSLGEAQALAGQAAIRVDSLTLHGSDDAPDLPLGWLLAEVVVSGANEIDWPQFAPTLLLRDGSAVGPSGPVAPINAEQTLLRYLVPNPVAGQAVRWELTDPTTGEVRRWQIDPPPSAHERLAGLQLDPLTRVERDGEAFLLHLVLHNPHPTPIAFVAADLEVRQSGESVAVEWLTPPTPIAPQSSQEYTLRLSGEVPLLLTLGPLAFEIAWPPNTANAGQETVLTVP